MTNKSTRDVSYYLSLPYGIHLRRDEDGDVVARIDELPGCMSHGTDETEALTNLRDMQKLWLEECIATGRPIPEPRPDEPLPSGKWVQRVPRTLHRRLAEMAKEEGVSLNQLVTSMLSQQVTARAFQRAVEKVSSTLIGQFETKGMLFQHYWDQSIWIGPGDWLIEGQPSAPTLASRVKRLFAEELELKVPNASKQKDQEGHCFFAAHHQR